MLKCVSGISWFVSGGGGGGGGGKRINSPPPFGLSFLPLGFRLFLLLHCVLALPPPPVIYFDTWRLLPLSEINIAHLNFPSDEVIIPLLSFSLCSSYSNNKDEHRQAGLPGVWVCA